MATNKFILVPEDIYRGLTSEDTGNINLDYTKRALENVKREKTDPATKYARYNQELRRYLHLKKEHDEKPVRVEVTNATPKISTATPTGKTQSQTTAPGTAPGTSQAATAAIFQPKTPASELYNEINLATTKGTLDSPLIRSSTAQQAKLAKLKVRTTKDSCIRCRLLNFK